MRFKVFISSVQREFAAERQMLAEYVRKDALLGKFFDVFLFEEEPACDVEARDLYLPEVEKSDIYLGILGAQFGNADADGVSPTERDYESNGAVQVMLFRDRLEIMNPGTLPRGWTAETLLTTHESVARNKVIAKALDWAGYVERSGHGTEFIIEKCEAQGLATPQYKPDSAIFHTIIWRKTTESAVSQEASCQVVQSNGPVVAQSAFSQGGPAEGADMGGVVGGVMGGVENATSTIHEKVFDFISKREMSNAEIARELGWSRVYGGLARVIKNLLADGIIEYTIPEKPRSRLQKYRLTEKGRQMLVQKGKHK